jgi:hypothetical protein
MVRVSIPTGESVAVSNLLDSKPCRVVHPATACEPGRTVFETIHRLV